MSEKFTRFQRVMQNLSELWTKTFAGGRYCGFSMSEQSAGLEADQESKMFDSNHTLFCFIRKISFTNEIDSKDSVLRFISEINSDMINSTSPCKNSASDFVHMIRNKKCALSQDEQSCPNFQHSEKHPDPV